MTLAARRCRVAQPSLSQQIRKLEETLGVELFDRFGKGVALTESGHRLLPRARRILAEVVDTQENLRAEIARGAGRLVIGAIPTMAPFLLPPVLLGIRHAFPEGEIVVREDLTASLVEAVVDHEIDAAITSTPIDHELVEVELVGREELVVVTPRSHELAARGELTLADLRGQPTVSLHEMHCLGEQIDAFCARAELRPEISCRTTQLATVLEFIRLGLGVSLVPAMAVRHLADDDFAILRVREPAPEREIALIRRRGRRRPRMDEGLGERVRRALAGSAIARE